MGRQHGRRMKGIAGVQPKNYAHRRRQLCARLSVPAATYKRLTCVRQGGRPDETMVGPSSRKVAAVTHPGMHQDS